VHSTVHDRSHDPDKAGLAGMEMFGEINKQLVERREKGLGDDLFSDIVRGTIDGATSDAEGTFNLSGRVAITVSDAIRLISEALGVTPDVRHAAERPGDQQQTAGSSERAKEAFGFTPTVDPAEGIARQVVWTVAEVNGA